MAIGTTYGVGTIHQDLQDVVFQVTPTDRPVTNLIGNSSARSIVHQWTKRALTTRADNAQVEGDTIVLTAPTMPSIETNLTQIMQKTFRVSESLAASDVAGLEDQIKDQIKLRLTELMTDAEHTYIRGSQASGSTTVARRMGGMMNVITTNKTTAASGVTMTEDILNSFFQLQWAASQITITHLLLPATLKRRCSTFGTNVTRFENVISRERTNTVMVYHSDFGDVDLILCRDMLTGTDANSMLGFVPSFFSKAWLRPVKAEIIAKTADAVDGRCVLENTLEFGDEKAGSLYLGLN